MGLSWDPGTQKSNVQALRFFYGNKHMALYEPQDLQIPVAVLVGVSDTDSSCDPAWHAQ